MKSCCTRLIKFKHKKTAKPHTIGESLLLPAAEDIWLMLFCEKEQLNSFTRIICLITVYQAGLKK